eukprot:48519_1
MYRKYIAYMPDKEAKSKRMSLEHLPKSTYDYYSNPVQISNNEFVIAIDSNKQLIKYNANSRQWTEYFNYHNNFQQKMDDWSKKTNFENIKYVGYVCDNQDVTTGEIHTYCKDKIFVDFSADPFQRFGKAYSWITIPNARLCMPPSPMDNDVKLAYDRKCNIFYIFRTQIHIKSDKACLGTIINMNTKTTQSFDVSTAIFCKYHDKSDVKSCLAINGKLHIIACFCYYVNKSSTMPIWKYFHCIYDTKNIVEGNVVQGKVNIFKERKWVGGIHSHLIYVYPDSIYHFIGKRIRIYSINQKIWQRPDMKIALGALYKAQIACLFGNKRFVMLFGEHKNSYLDLKTKKFVTLTTEFVKRIAYSPKYALSIGDMENDNEMIVYGFVRQFWNVKWQLQLSHSDVLRLIIVFYQQEYIHMLNKNKQAIINVTDIISSD